MLEIAVILSTAARNAASFVFDGLLKPLTFRTNCREAARISSSVTGGEKLKRILIFRHMSMLSMFWDRLMRQGNRRASAMPRTLLLPISPTAQCLNEQLSIPKA